MVTSTTPLGGKEIAIVARLGGGAAGIAAAMNPEHDRKLAVGLCAGGSKDVQEEAVLAGAIVLEDHVAVDVAWKQRAP